MEFLTILIFLLRFLQTFCFDNITNSNAIASAISDVTLELFTSRGVNFEIAAFGKSTNIDVIDELRAKNENFTSKVARTKELDFELQLTGSTLFIVDNTESLGNALMLASATFRDSPYHVAYIENGKDLDPSTLTPYGTKPGLQVGFFSDFMYFLLDYGDEIKLATLEWWTSEMCYETQLVNLNSFDKRSLKWEKPLKIDEKFTNFHGCTLTFYSLFFPMTLFDMRSEISTVFPIIYQKRDAKEFEMVKILAEAGNFKFGNFRSYSPSAHAYIVSNYLNDLTLHCPTTFYTLHLDTMHPVQDPYTNYEKLLLPFDSETWTYLILVFVFAFVGIFIVNQLPQVIRDLVFGEGVRMPSFNVIGAFFGMGQTRLPGNNFGRIILMFFILFCLIMRTGYQGVFFEMFTSDMRRKAPETYADMKERDYTVYIIEQTDSKVIVSSKDAMEYGLAEDERPRIEYVPLNVAQSYFERMKNRELNLRCAVPSTEADMKALKFLYSKLPATLKQKISLPLQGICTARNNFFSILSTKVVEQLIAAGIPQYWYSYLLDYELRSPPEDPSEPQVFSMSDLNFGFVVWYIACAITILVFVAEFLVFYGKIWGMKCLRKFIGLILFLRLLMRVLRNGTQ